MKNTTVGKVDKYSDHMKIIYIHPDQKIRITSLQKQNSNDPNHKMPPACERYLKAKKNDPL
ncbi:MAG TPA: hypothetical protein VHZ50_19535 [Puia sp.]|jgi:hypothetical protein|nr:hypothetical protein [Puia sp.]